MERIIAWWARNAVAANLLMVGIIIAGTLSFFALEREVWPTVRLNWVEVNIAWPGAAPQEVEEQIIIRIEESLKDLENIERIRSIAREGSAVVYIEANRRVDVADFISDVKLRIDSITRLPRDIESPVVREILTRSDLIYIAVQGDVSEREMKRAAERVRDEIALLAGVPMVEMLGQRREEVSIELSEEAMRRYGLTFDEVARAIRNTSVNTSSGTVRTETGDVMLRARNLADSEEEFANIIVRQTSDGAAIRVGDVARVEDGFEDRELRTRLNGESAILVRVMSGEQMNVVQASRSVREWLAEAKDRMPPGIELSLWFDFSKVYDDRMETISSSAVYGLLLVFLVLILTLRPKVALWVTLGIGTAFAGAFTILPSAEVSLNMLSLFAFLLVIGVVVDDAIVVGENIHTEAHKGSGGINAAILGTQLVAKPVIYAVLTTMITFAPWLFLSGVDVEFTRQISLIVIAALSFSLIEALLILPAHLRHLKPREKLNTFDRLQKHVADSIINFANGPYRQFVTKTLSHRWLTVSCFAAVLIVSFGFVSSGWVKNKFMPEVENELIRVNVDLPIGTPYSRSEQIVRQLEEAQEKLVAESNGSAGGESALIKSWFTLSQPESILALVELAPPEVRDLPGKKIAERLRELIGEIPDAESVELNYTINNRDPGLEFAVATTDLATLRAAVSDLKAQLKTYDALYDIRDNMQSSTEEIRLDLKPGAQKLGLTLGEVSRQVRQAYYGEEAQRLPRNGNDVRVMVRYPEESRRSLDSLENFRIRTADGRQVPLLAVADVDFAPGLNRINRRERQRSAVVGAEMVGEMRQQITQDLEENFFPEWEKKYPTVTRGAIGVAEGQAKFVQEILSLYLVALFSMYALIAVAFRSYAQPALVMTAIPFGFMGAVFGHLLFGMPMSIYSYLGLGAAAGVVVNDNLVLVDYINRLRDKGLPVLEALVEAGVARFRPILLTSLTTFVGLIPMMAERSTQAQFLKPTVVSLAFGVALATTVTLILVPTLFAAGADIRRFMLQLWTGRRIPRLEEELPVQAPAE